MQGYGLTSLVICINCRTHDVKNIDMTEIRSEIWTGNIRCLGSGILENEQHYMSWYYKIKGVYDMYLSCLLTITFPVNTIFRHPISIKHSHAYNQYCALNSFPPIQDCPQSKTSAGPVSVFCWYHSTFTVWILSVGNGYLRIFLFSLPFKYVYHAESSEQWRSIWFRPKQ
jgi:hypothetical protein